MSAGKGTERLPKFTVAQVLRATGGRLLRGDPGSASYGVSTDTRTLQPGELFVALKGPNHNGHDFLPEAAERSARGAIVQKGERFFPHLSGAPKSFFVVETDDTVRALGDLAKAYRERLSPRVVAVTGSVGKTTVKDMIAAALSRNHTVCATEGNHNNLIGVPETIFRTGVDDEFLVVELGADRPGEIARLAEIVSPNLGVLTQVTESHLERFGDLVTVAEEKAQLFRKLGPEGTAVFREEIVFESLIRARTEARVITFGLSSAADVRATDLETDAQSRLGFRIVTRSADVPVSLSVCGRYQVWNALAAFAACEILGVPGKEIVGALEEFEGRWGRMQRRKTQAGAWLIDDGYNANPASVRAAVETLATTSAKSRLLVLGDMLDLGTQSARLHRQIGREISRWNIDDLIVCGERWEDYVEGAMEGGMTPERIHPFTTHEEVIRYVKGKLQEGDVILVKGSRATHMERVCEGLPAEEQMSARPAERSILGRKATASVQAPL